MVQMSAPSTPSATVAPEKSDFSERDTKLLVAAMLSLKSGAPEIDITKFVKNGEFKTAKTAQNTWGVLKKKLAALNPAAEGDDEAVDGAPATPVAPKTKAKATPKKRVKKESSEDASGGDANGDDQPSQPKKQKTPRVTAAQKKAEAAAAAASAAGGEALAESTGSPVKKKTPRKAAAKKSAAAVASEDGEKEAEVKAGDKVAETAEEDVAAAATEEDTEEASGDVKMEDE
ncbi:hypothetical protein TI39_contig4309g00006 [Zymoseptoria brevis]|uniref:Uncharacterized protein n=1 Tax=Zymoseptoria brevis TaxID=1047168 RepID=A0A0F4G7Y0_9PEZI|nr:hypothetical protein TI39_contig4309g00006 [Zymoseptoria brevis]